jgi:hypothetical protein
MMKAVKSSLLVLGTGYILLYFSEHLFWGRARPEDSLGEWAVTWMVYSLLGFIFLHLIAHFKVGNLWALFLAGAIFGWMTEGLVVQTAYESLPLSISFTGLAWHALVSVWIGWYAVQRCLHSPGLRSTFGLAALIGVFFGVWAITWWVEPDGGVAPPGEFAIFIFSTTLLLIAAYRLAGWSASAGFDPSRWAIGLVYGLFALYFLFVTLPAAPVAGFVLPLLLGLAGLGLLRFRGRTEGVSFIAFFQGRIPARNLLGLLAIPAASTLIYWLAHELGLRWHTNWILYLITTPLGFILFGASLYKAWQNKSTP